MSVLSKSAFLAVSLAALCLGTPRAVYADASDMEIAFGNTIVSSYRDGGWVRHWLDRDGTYRSQFRDGRRLTGRWTREGERLCINDIRPRMIVNRFCSQFAPVDGRSTWWGRDPLGRRVENRLVRGRSEMP